MLSQETYVITPHQKNRLLQQKSQELHPLWTKVTLLIGKVSGMYSSSQGFDNDVADILMTSWRKGTFSNYSLYMNKWFNFASCNKVSPVEPPVQVALASLISLVRQIKSFNQICMARSALSSVINQQQNVSFGNIPIVKRYMKGIFENNPTLPKFQFTWNVSLLFNYFRNMQDIHALDIQKLTQKLVMLMTLISGEQRTIHSIRVSDIKILDNKVVIPIMSLTE